MKPSINLLGCLAPAIAGIGCSATQHGALVDEPQVEQHPTATKDWFVDEWVREYYVYSHPPGSVELDVSAQVLSIAIPRAGSEVSSAFDIASRVPHFVAGTLTELDAVTLLVGGVNTRSGEGELFRLVLNSNSAVIQSATPEWRGPELSRISSMAVFPDATKVALFDHALGIVAVYDLATRTVVVVADRTRSAALTSMKYVSVHNTVADPGQEPGMMIWVTSVSEPDLGAGRLVGKSVGLFDRDADGIFESVH